MRCTHKPSEKGKTICKIFGLLYLYKYIEVVKIFTGYYPQNIEQEIDIIGTVEISNI